MNAQENTLWLADRMEDGSHMFNLEVADELRRLNVVNQQLLDALVNSLQYAEDVLVDKQALACYKPNVVQKHVKQIHDAITLVYPDWRSKK